MGTSSILGGERMPRRSGSRDVDLLGPSDSSDSGSDVQGERVMPTGPDNAGELGAVPTPRGSTTDATGTGERAGAFDDGSREAGDILPDQIVEGVGALPEEDLEPLDLEAVAAEEAEGDEDDEDDKDDEDDASDGSDGNNAAN